MIREISIMSQLPGFYGGVRPFEALAHSEDLEFVELARCNAIDFAEAFIMTASGNSLSIWEREIGIRSVKDESLEFRRARIINRYTVKPPFTVKWLDVQLKNFLGDAFVRTERDDDVEILYVYAELRSWPLLKEFETTIEMVLPLSMQYAKILSSRIEAMGGIYAGATMQNLLRFTVQPA